jgi:hypothetical protein
MALPIIAAGIAARAIAKKLASRAAGGITGKGSKAVNPVYRNTTDAIQRNSVKVVPTVKTPSIAESQAKIRQTLNIPAKGTPAYSRYSAKQAKDNTVSSQKAGKASTTISKKTYKK